MNGLLVAAVPLLPALTGLAAGLASRLAGARITDRISFAGASVSFAVAVAVGVHAIVAGDPGRGSWYVLDPAGGIFLTVIATVGLLSVLAAMGRPGIREPGFVRGTVPRVPYWVAFHLFWAALLAVPLADSLALAWLLIEATTAASAFLVAFSGRRAALEAGWKYLVLTTFGLAVALLGIVVLYGALTGNGAGAGLSTLDWDRIADGAGSLPEPAGLSALVLIVVGLATKVGWAPTHNWLPEAHSEAPAPISALLSAALLPAVALVVWRVVETLGPGLEGSAATTLPIAFGLVSLGVAVPFLWRSLPWKRLLAYSSLEHMGVIALAIGFANPLASAGLVVHVAGHALAKSLGFYAAIPLLGRHPDADREPLRGLPSASRPLAGAVGVSLAALAALPPSPLFLSEILILAGGIAAGHTVVVVVAAALLALGFLGLGHALIEALGGGVTHAPWRNRRSERRLLGLTVASTAGMLAIAAGGILLPGSELATGLMDGMRP